MPVVEEKSENKGVLVKDNKYSSSSESTGSLTSHAFLGVSVVLLGLTALMTNETFSNQLSNLLGGVPKGSIFESLFIGGVGTGGAAFAQEISNVYSGDNTSVEDELDYDYEEEDPEEITPPIISDTRNTSSSREEVKTTPTSSRDEADTTPITSSKISARTRKIEPAKGITPLKQLILEAKGQKALPSNVYKCKDFIGELREQIAIRMDTKQEFAQLLEKLFKQLAPCNVHAEEVKDGKVLKQSLAHYVSALEQKFTALKHQESGFDLEVAALLCDLEAHNPQEENPRLRQFESNYQETLKEKQNSDQYDSVRYPSLADKKKQLIGQYKELKKDTKEIIDTLCSENIYVAKPEEVLVTNKGSKKLVKDTIVRYALPGSAIALGVTATGVTFWYGMPYIVWGAGLAANATYVAGSVIASTAASGYNYIGGKAFNAYEASTEAASSTASYLASTRVGSTVSSATSTVYGGIEGTVTWFWDTTPVTMVRNATSTVTNGVYNAAGSFKSWFSINSSALDVAKKTAGVGAGQQLVDKLDPVQNVCYPVNQYGINAMPTKTDFICGQDVLNSTVANSTNVYGPEDLIGPKIPRGGLPNITDIALKDGLPTNPNTIVSFSGMVSSFLSSAATTAASVAAGATIGTVTAPIVGAVATGMTINDLRKGKEGSRIIGTASKIGSGLKSGAKSIGSAIVSTGSYLKSFLPNLDADSRMYIRSDSARSEKFKMLFESMFSKDEENIDYNCQFLLSQGLAAKKYVDWPWLTPYELAYFEHKVNTLHNLIQLSESWNSESLSQSTDTAGEVADNKEKTYSEIRRNSRLIKEKLLELHVRLTMSEEEIQSEIRNFIITANTRYRGNYGFEGPEISRFLPGGEFHNIESVFPDVPEKDIVEFKRLIEKVEDLELRYRGIEDKTSRLAQVLRNFIYLEDCYVRSQIEWMERIQQRNECVRERKRRKEEEMIRAEQEEREMQELASKLRSELESSENKRLELNPNFVYDLTGTVDNEINIQEDGENSYQASSDGAKGGAADKEQGDGAKGGAADKEQGDGAKGGAADKEQGDGAKGGAADKEQGDGAKGGAADKEQGDGAKGGAADKEQGDGAKGGAADKEQGDGAKGGAADKEQPNVRKRRKISS